MGVSASSWDFLFSLPSLARQYVQLCAVFVLVCSIYTVCVLFLVWFELVFVLFNSVITVQFYRVLIFDTATALVFAMESVYIFRLYSVLIFCLLFFYSSFLYVLESLSESSFFISQLCFCLLHSDLIFSHLNGKLCGV